MAVHEYDEWLRIETGVPGDDQESSFMNGTLQSVPCAPFTGQEIAPTFIYPSRVPA